MTELTRKLPRQGWRRVQRLTGMTVALSVACSVILTNIIMEIFSAGINLQGLAVSIVTPIVLATPLIFFMCLRHEQLQHANGQLEQLASRDFITGSLNRRAFTRDVTQQLDHPPAEAAAFGMLLIADADNFKAINDRFGHDAGDTALRLIADAIAGAIRSGDSLGRLGGEEFGIFLAGADLTVGDHIAERIRRSVAAIRFAPEGSHWPLSVSIGGASHLPGTSFAELYRLADRRLYEAKAGRRDRVTLSRAA